jgi:hypothetical protein
MHEIEKARFFEVLQLAVLHGKRCSAFRALALALLVSLALHY